MWWIYKFRDFNLTWNIFVVQLVFVNLCTCANSIWSLKLPAVHWNSSNPMFKTSNNDHIIEVNLYDEIDFLCPYYEEDGRDHEHEYYIIHLVSKLEYDDCMLYEDHSPVAIVNCRNPRRFLRFTLLFDPYLAIPGSPQFKAGGTYYFITTSTGLQDGVDNISQGACHYQNMKVTIKVCCETTTTTPGITSTSDASHPVTHNPTLLNTIVTAAQESTTESTTSTTTTTTTTTPTVMSTTQPTEPSSARITSRWWFYTTKHPASSQHVSTYSASPAENEAHEASAATTCHPSALSVLLSPALLLLSGAVSSFMTSLLTIVTPYVALVIKTLVTSPRCISRKSERLVTSQPRDVSATACDLVELSPMATDIMTSQIMMTSSASKVTILPAS